MSESQYWQRTVRPALGSYGLLERIENSTGTKGTADVNYCLLGIEGWVELKHLRGWPVRATTRVRLPHFTLDQVLWHERRLKARSRTCLLAGVGRDHFILPADGPSMRLAYEDGPGMTRDEYRQHAVVWATGAFPTTTVMRYLTGRALASDLLHRNQ